MRLQKSSICLPEKTTRSILQIFKKSGTACAEGTRLARISYMNVISNTDMIAACRRRPDDIGCYCNSRSGSGGHPTADAGRPTGPAGDLAGTEYGKLGSIGPRRRI